MKISVIVPVYNVEKYVGRCIQSLISQIHRNIEIIIVDDGSSDKSGEIVDRMKERDDRILVCHKENGGVSSARNRGLDMATGNYIMFVDGDDYLEIDCISQLVKYITPEVSLVMFPYIREYEKKHIRTELFEFDEDIMKEQYKNAEETFENHDIWFTNREVKEKLLAKLIGPGEAGKKISPLGMERLNTVWGKLYRRDAIGNIRFTDIRKIVAEDGWFNIQVFAEIKGSVVYTNSTFYHYEKENQSSLLHTYNADYIERKWTFYRYLKDFLTEKNQKKFELNYSNRIVCELLEVVLNIGISELTYSEKRRELKRILTEKDYDTYFKKADLNHMDLKWKLFFKLCQRKRAGIVILAADGYRKICK